MIMFQMGSGRYDADADMFRFNATDANGRIVCAIEREAFEGLTRSRVRRAIANEQFADWEALVIKLTERKYSRSGVNDNGAILVETDDIRELWFA
jgi:hypothetical protein